jgi:hypothetical protein
MSASKASVENEYRSHCHKALSGLYVPEEAITMRLLRSYRPGRRSSGSPPANFSTPGQMLALLQERARLECWPIDGRHIDRLRGKAPRPPKDPNQCLSFDIWLGDFDETMDAMFEWLAASAGKFWVHPDDPDRQIKFANDSYLPRRKSKPRVRWVRLDLGPMAPAPLLSADAIGPAHKPAAMDLLAAFCLHPFYVEQVRQGDRPNVWVAGLQSQMPGDPTPWQRVPAVRHRGTHTGIGLDASVPRTQSLPWAAPSRHRA